MTEVSRVTVVFPMCGRETGPDIPFRPFSDLGDETVIEAAIRPFRKWHSKIAKLVFVILNEHEQQYQVSGRLREIAGDFDSESISIERVTRGPAETAFLGIERAHINGPVLICDADHSVEVDPIFELIQRERDVACIVPTWNLRSEDLKAWSVAAVSDDRVVGIAEKRLPEGPGHFVGVIGCYYFSKALDFTETFAGSDRYVSEVLGRLVAAGKDVRAVPLQEAEFFGDSGKLWNVRARRVALSGSVFCDIDGVLVEHEETPDYSRPLRVLPGSRERLQDWQQRGYMIVLTTARDHALEPSLKAALDDALIPYHRLVTGLPSGPRFLINDRKPSAVLARQAEAVELERNEGIQNVELRSADPTVLRRFKGGSFAETLLVEDEDRMFVRKRVSKRAHLSLGYSKLKHQYFTMERFSRCRRDLVPALYGELDNTFEYCYDLEYLPGHRLLSQVSPQEQASGLVTLLDSMASHVYSSHRRHHASGVDWLLGHLSNKIYPRVEEMLRHPRLGPWITRAAVTIDGEKYSGLQELLAKVTSGPLLTHLAPTAVSMVHGDLTFENVLFADGDVKVIDMDGADYLDAAELDLGKLFQSVAGRYEAWAHSHGVLFEQSGDELVSATVHRIDDAMEALCVDAWRSILSLPSDHVRQKAQFYMGLHFIRMVPFRLQVSDDQAVYALANAVKWIGRAAS